jgi:hypothetical protein
MIRWIIFVALLVSSFACAGCGSRFWSYSPCISGDTDPSDPLSCPPTPEPTYEPSPTTLGPGCVDHASLLFPSSNTVPSTYAGTMYLTVPAGEMPGSFLAIEVGQTNPMTNVPQFEIGTQLVALSGPAPSFVATPPPGFAGIYTSSNLPVVATWGVGITMVDTCDPPVCYPFTFATLNVKAVQRTTLGDRGYRRP